MIYIFKRLTQLLQRKLIISGQELIEVSKEGIAEAQAMMDTSVRLMEKEMERSRYSLYIFWR